MLFLWWYWGDNWSCIGNCLKTKRFLQELTERFQEMRISLNLNEVTFILGNFPQNIPNILQFLMLVAKYYINMCKGTNKHLTFLEYKINVQSIFQSHKEMALKNYELQEFLEAWVPYKKLLNNNWKGMTVYTIKGHQRPGFFFVFFLFYLRCILISLSGFF